MLDKILELFIELDPNTNLDFPIIYSAANKGVAKISMEQENSDLKPLFETIINIVPCPKGDEHNSLQMMITMVDYDDYMGKIAIGRIVRGEIQCGQDVMIANGDIERKTKIGKLYVYEGLKRIERQKASMGDIVSIVGN